MASHREHQGSISSSVPYHPSCPDRPLFLLACLRKLRSRTRLAAAVTAAVAAAWPSSKGNQTRVNVYHNVNFLGPSNTVISVDMT